MQDKDQLDRTETDTVWRYTVHCIVLIALSELKEARTSLKWRKPLNTKPDLRRLLMTHAPQGRKSDFTVNLLHTICLNYSS